MTSTAIPDSPHLLPLSATALTIRFPASFTSGRSPSANGFATVPAAFCIAPLFQHRVARIGRSPHHSLRHLTGKPIPTPVFGEIFFNSLSDSSMTLDKRIIRIKISDQQTTDKKKGMA